MLRNLPGYSLGRGIIWELTPVNILKNIHETGFFNGLPVRCIFSFRQFHFLTHMSCQIENWDVWRRGGTYRVGND